jgi:GABA(A) receptor-associated protein
MSIFKKNHSFEKRKEESRKISEKYTDRIPIICEKNPQSIDTPDIDKKKYLVPSDLTVGQFLFVVRKRMKLSPEKAIFLFINNIIPNSTELISQMYKQYKDEDGFLYIVYSGESTFGCNGKP